MSSGRGVGSSTAHLAFSAGDLSWQADDERPPACRVPFGLPPEEALERHRMFDGGTGRKPDTNGWKRIRAAIAICHGCPVVNECLAYAMNPAHRVEGVWGGGYFPPSGTQKRRGPRIPIVPPDPAGRRSVA